MIGNDKKHKFLENKLAVIGAVLISAMVILAILAPVICQDPLAVSPANRLKAPSGVHIFGTDSYGRDLFSRVLYGARISMVAGFSVVIIAVLAGVTLGLLAGYYKKTDAVIMRVCDSLKAIPSVLLAIALMSFLGASTKNVILTLAIVNIPDIARITRSQTLVVKNQLYIEAMKASGASPFRIIMCHILPNVISAVIVQVSFVFASTIITAAALSFLGVGVPAPQASWGNILYEGKDVMFKAWWMIVFPGIFTAVSVFGLNMLGDGIRDVLDPKSN